VTHPARLIPYDDLIDGLTACVEAGTVNVSVDDTAGLSLFCYSKSCVYDKAWTPFSEVARGLILDWRNQRVVATPFPKFFNVSERSDTIPDLPFEIFEKLDGSLIILFHHDGAWRAATKGSFRSEQAAWAQGWASRHDLSCLTPGTTYLFEAIYPQNRIVIQYGHTALVLLGAYAETGEEYPYDKLLTVGKALGWPVAKRYPVAAISDLLAQAKSLPANEEGWVLRFANGHRLKVKGEEYLRIHRMISRLTPLSVWESMMAGDDLITFRKELPEEFWPDFDQMWSLIDRQARKIVADTREALANARQGQDLSDKDVGLMLTTFPAHVRSFVFPYRKQGGELMQGRSRAALFRAIRPTGNRLEGYVPSSSVVRVFEETGA
jgi:RNA ligase